jgi:hypothetical protein
MLPMQVTTDFLNLGWRPTPPHRSQGACHQHLQDNGGCSRSFVMPPRGSVIDVFYVDGGRSWTSGTTSQGRPLSMFFALMVGAHRPPTPPPRGAHHRHFFTLMVGAPESLASHPRGPVVDVFCTDGGRFQISSTTSQGGHR